MRRRDEGAAAVEFALILPILLLLLMGIIDFGRAYNARITLTHAAREGVRIWALEGAASPVTAAARSHERTVDAATSLTGVTTSRTTCTFGLETRLTVSASFTYITPFIAELAPSTTTLSTEGVMRCGG